VAGRSIAQGFDHAVDERLRRRRERREAPADRSEPDRLGVALGRVVVARGDQDVVEAGEPAGQRPVEPAGVLPDGPVVDLDVRTRTPR
jgi:hypothetical protein